MRRVILSVLGTIAGLVGLLSFKTHTTSVAVPAAVSTTNPGTTSAAPVTAPGQTSAPASTSARASTSASGSSSLRPKTETVTGNSVDTQYGPVQVKITVASGKIISATAIEYPSNDGRSQQINSYAVPALEKESIDQRTAGIDMISGATYTSNGYIQSLQSALDKL